MGEEVAAELTVASEQRAGRAGPLVPAVDELQVVRPRRLIRVLAPTAWVAAAAVVFGGLVVSGPPGLWVLGLALVPVVAWVAAAYVTTRVEVEGERMRLVTPLSVHEFDRRSVEAVAPGAAALFLFRQPPPMLWFTGGTRTLRRTRRHPEGRSRLVASLAMPGINAAQVRAAMGWPSTAIASAPRRPLFIERGRLRPLAWIYLGGVVLMVLCYVLRA